MEVDERLEVLCEEFACLEEPEKDYILGIAQILLSAVSIKDDESHNSNIKQECLI